jgi:hypothetical protein
MNSITPITGGTDMGVPLIVAGSLGDREQR